MPIVPLLSSLAKERCVQDKNGGMVDKSSTRVRSRSFVSSRKVPLHKGEERCVTAHKKFIIENLKRWPYSQQQII